VADQENNNGSRSRDIWQYLRTKVPGIAAGVALSVGIGWALLTSVIGDNTVFYSYDQPFERRGFTYPKEAVLLYLDDASHTQLNQSYLKPWDRALYARLLRRLTEEKAAAVVFDIVFTDPMDPATDQEFAQAMLDNGKAVIATDFSMEDYSGTTTISGGQFVKLLPLFDGAAADVGSDALQKL
jgi:CHASE2 domain-containing sensor protein